MTKEELLQMLLQESILEMSIEEKVALAEDAETEVETLFQLIHDGEPTVRRAALRNTNFPFEDYHKNVRLDGWDSDQFLYNPALPFALAADPAATWVERWAEEKDGDMRRVLFGASRASNNPSWMSRQLLTYVYRVFQAPWSKDVWDTFRKDGNEIDLIVNDIAAKTGIRSPGSLRVIVGHARKIAIAGEGTWSGVADTFLEAISQLAIARNTPPLHRLSAIYALQNVLVDHGYLDSEHRVQVAWAE